VMPDPTVSKSTKYDYYDEEEELLDDIEYEDEGYETDNEKREADLIDLIKTSLQESTGLISGADVIKLLWLRGGKIS
jgi:hypothetical protein